MSDEASEAEGLALERKAFEAVAASRQSGLFWHSCLSPVSADCFQKLAY